MTRRASAGLKLRHLAPSNTLCGLTLALQDPVEQRLLTVEISIIVVVCFLCSVLHGRKARRSKNEALPFAWSRAVTTSRQQKLSRVVPQFLLPMVMLSLVSVASGARLATNVACLPYKPDESLLDFDSAKPQRFAYRRSAG